MFHEYWDPNILLLHLCSDEYTRHDRDRGLHHVEDFITETTREDAVFDVVIGESITAFLKDKQRGVSE